MPLQALDGPPQTEQPVFWLGLAGFPPVQRHALEASVGRANGLCRWRICAIGDADGWWMNGAKCAITSGSRLKVAPGLPTEHTLRLELKEVTRPLAFAEPLAPDNLDARCVFDPASEQSVHAALLQFETWLLPMRARFALGAMLLQRDSEQRHGIYHVSHGGALLAVFDFGLGLVAVSPRADPLDLFLGRWERRPASAGQAPASFASCTITQLAWGYVWRTERDMLPQRYRTEMIYYRHVPRVPMRWLRDSQLLVLRELSAEPGTLESLCGRTSLSAGQVAHDLACLYYAGSVTTTPETAPGAGSSVNSSGLWHESRSPAAPSPRPRDELTAPALLEPRPKVPPEPGVIADPLFPPS